MRTHTACHSQQAGFPHWLLLVLPASLLSQITCHFQVLSDASHSAAKQCQPFFSFMCDKFGCCGVNGPEDFKSAPHFQLLHSHDAFPEACCRREIQSRDGVFISKENCLMGKEIYQNRQVMRTQHFKWDYCVDYLMGNIVFSSFCIEGFKFIYLFVCSIQLLAQPIPQAGSRWVITIKI